MAVAPNWTWLIPGMCLSLLGMSIGGPIFFSMTSDIAPREKRAAYFGYQAMAFSICGIIGPLVGGFFFQFLDYRWFLGLGTVLSFGGSYLRSLLKDPREDPNFVPEGGRVERLPVGQGGARRGLMGDFLGNLREFGGWARVTPGVAAYLVLISLPAFSGKLLESYFTVYLNEVALILPASIGLLAAISGSAAIPANLWGGRAADAVGRRIAVPVAHVLSGLWMVTITLVSKFNPLAVVFVFDGLIHGGLFPSIDALNADLCPSQRRGTFNGVFRLLGVLVAIPAPAAGAWLWSHFGSSAPIRAAAAVTVLAGVLLLRLMPSLTRTRPSPASLGARLSPG